MENMEKKKKERGKRVKLNQNIALLSQGYFLTSSSSSNIDPFPPLSFSMIRDGAMEPTRRSST